MPNPPKSRYLKVVRSFGDYSKASLPLTGRWLEKAGFVIGSRVEVVVRKGCLMIVPLVEEEK
ncbi:MAG: SymE family type I addiction module toxin [Ectothiorhodospiraceae bacterium]|nr:SymE family type I addiction module toxin [Ectothiorhodospiraceae bacterium]